MGRGEETNSKREPKPRYWTSPKIPVGIKLDKSLLSRSRATAKAQKIPFIRLVEQGLEYMNNHYGK